MPITLEVGPGQTYATINAAVSAAAAGDTIEIQPGTYHEAVKISLDDLTVRGAGSGSDRPAIDMTGLTIDNEKGIIDSVGANFSIENVALVGASVPDANGAGIRWEGTGTLTVTNCLFQSNEDGILGGDNATNTADIEDSEFVDNSRGDPGYTHSVYFSEIASVTFRGNWSHKLYPDGSDVGHLFKSRAKRNYLLYNRLTAEDTHSSYEINLPEGGEAYVIGNLIQQRVGSQAIMISFGDGDGTQYTGSKLYVVNNTFVNEYASDATFVRTTQADAQLVIANNLLVGAGTLVSGGTVALVTNNVATTAPGLTDQAGFDYRLVAGSPAIDAGSDLSAVSAGMSLVPDAEYVQPTATEGRGTAGAAIDVGAYEFGNVPPAGGAEGLPIDPTGDAGTGGGGGAGGSGGGCCDTNGNSGGGGLLALGAAVALAVTRRRGARSSAR